MTPCTVDGDRQRGARDRRARDRPVRGRLRRHTVYSADGFPQADAQRRRDALPGGVTFVDNGNGTATLTGTAGVPAVGTYPITITASNGIDPDAPLDVTIVVVPPLAITTTYLLTARSGTAYGAHIVATGGMPPYSFTVVAARCRRADPGADGTITGTPTGPDRHLDVHRGGHRQRRPAADRHPDVCITIGRARRRSTSTRC